MFKGVDDEYYRDAEFEIDELVRLCSSKSFNLVVELKSRDRKGRLYFKEGRLVHAKTADYMGRRAFDQIRSWNNGMFRISPFRSEVIHTISLDVEHLLEGRVQ